MKVINQKVKHKTFGEGIIISITEKGNNASSIMEIVFEPKTIQMQYPHAFDGYITALDNDVQKTAEQDLQTMRERAAKEEREKEQRREQERLQKEMEEIEKKRISEQRKKPYAGRHYQAGDRNFVRDDGFIDWLQKKFSNHGTAFAESTAKSYEQSMGKLLVEEGIAYPYKKGHDAFVKELNEATLEERIDSYSWHISTKTALKNYIVDLYKEYLKSQT